VRSADGSYREGREIRHQSPIVEVGVCRPLCAGWMPSGISDPITTLLLLGISGLIEPGAPAAPTLADGGDAWPCRRGLGTRGGLVRLVWLDGGFGGGGPTSER